MSALFAIHLRPDPKKTRLHCAKPEQTPPLRRGLK